jgi:hypothetical protein
MYWGLYGILGLNLSPTPTAVHLCCISTVVAICLITVSFYDEAQSVQFIQYSIRWGKFLVKKTCTHEMVSGLTITTATFTKMKTLVTRKLDSNLIKKTSKILHCEHGYLILLII